MTQVSSHTPERSGFDFDGLVVGILTFAVVILAGFLSLSQFAIL